MSETSVFNKNNRTTNSIKSSLWGAIKSILNIVLGFVYRTIFIYFLGADYLGLNGLFTDILQVLSLAELGITTAIVFRFYAPISKNDYVQVGKLMNYLKIVYRYIAAFILFAGLILTPFIKSFINEDSTIPSDVNIYLIYLLFLFNTVSSYLFVYKQNILTADQRGYIFSIIGIVTSLFRYTFQILVLVFTRDYTLTLLSGILVTLILNIVFSFCIQSKYKKVFDIKESLSSEDKKSIMKDTKAVLLHRIGATVKLSTDSIVLSKFVSLVSTGVYSNYSMIISGIQTLIGQLLGSFVSSVGNAHVKLSHKENYEVYKKLLFVDLWISSVTIVCTYLLINDLILLWFGEIYLFDKITIIMLCIQFYIIISRQINISYTNGCGLFTKDRFRPLIEAVLNLVISIVFVKIWGIVGVFIGTVISSVVTVFWREPLILYRDEFNESVINYWKTYLSFSLFSVFLCCAGDFIKQKFFSIDSIVKLFLEAIICFILVNVLLICLFNRREEYSYLKQLVKSRFLSKFSRK